MTQTPIPIRAHHVTNLRANVPIESLAKDLFAHKYIDRLDHPFVKESFGFLQKLRENPEVEIKLVAGEKDFICEICPLQLKNSCPDFNPQANALYGTAFWQKDMHVMNRTERDYTAAEEIGLDIGPTYLVKEVL